MTPEPRTDASTPGSGRASAPVVTGEILAGKYRVDRVLGEGGMGVVVAATHLQLEEPVALKFLLLDAAADSSASRRFLREAQAAVKIKSEHVARVRDVGTLDGGRPFIVMEYLEGRDLARVLHEDGPLPAAVVVAHVLQACDAIAEAHHAGVVHRDLKPSNLFLTRRNDGSTCVKVLDFGISKVTARTEGERVTLTHAHTPMGTPAYMSPEQLRSAKDVDARTDVWSLGAILMELLTGAPPFPAESMAELCALILTSPAPRCSSRRSDVPPALDDVVATCLAKAPADRYATVGDLARALRATIPHGDLADTAVGTKAPSVVRARAPSPQTPPAAEHPSIEPAEAPPPSAFPTGRRAAPRPVAVLVRSAAVVVGVSLATLATLYGLGLTVRPLAKKSHPSCAAVAKALTARGPTRVAEAPQEAIFPAPAPTDPPRTARGPASVSASPPSAERRAPHPRPPSDGAEPRPARPSTPDDFGGRQ